MGTRAIATIFVMASWTSIGCATQSTTTQSTPPDTEKQGKARSDLEQCNSVAGGRAHSMTVSPDGKYSFQIAGRPAADAIVACMTSKGYAGESMTLEPEGPRDTIRSGGRGQPRQ
jgi:hypothetical protein